MPESGKELRQRQRQRDEMYHHAKLSSAQLCFLSCVSVLSLSVSLSLSLSLSPSLPLSLTHNVLLSRRVPAAAHHISVLPHWSREVQAWCQKDTAICYPHKIIMLFPQVQGYKILKGMQKNNLSD